jgi:hypothetical protein
VTGAGLAQTGSGAGLFGAALHYRCPCLEMRRNESSATKRTCKALNKKGERCGARAVERGLCAAHAGKVDMGAIGRKGGLRSPLTKLRREADDGLRSQAREVLSQALRGEQVDKHVLDAARSLFSYRSDVPPSAQERRGRDQPSKVVGLRDIVEVAAEAKLFSQSGWLNPTAELELLANVRAAKPDSG